MKKSKYIRVGNRIYVRLPKVKSVDVNKILNISELSTFSGLGDLKDETADHSETCSTVAQKCRLSADEYMSGVQFIGGVSKDTSDAIYDIISNAITVDDVILNKKYSLSTSISSIISYQTMGEFVVESINVMITNAKLVLAAQAHQQVYLHAVNTCQHTIYSVIKLMDRACTEFGNTDAAIAIPTLNMMLHKIWKIAELLCPINDLETPYSE